MVRPTVLSPGPSDPVGRLLERSTSHVPSADRPWAPSGSPGPRWFKAYPIQGRNVIAHIRKATQGRVALENCHPFVRELWGHYWAFAHNGNLLDFNPKLHAAFRPVGDTDSERAFCWIMQELAKGNASMPSVAELTATLRR